MIEFDEADVSEIIRSGERKSALIPIILLRWLGTSDLDSAQRAFYLLAYAGCMELCGLIFPEEQADELHLKLTNAVLQANEQGDKTARIGFSSDLWKLVRIATGELSWREFSVFGGLQSVIGRSKYKRVTRDTISARAAGFATIGAVPSNQPILPVHQVTRTLDKLEERGILLRYRAGRRTVYYGRWDMKPAEFKTLMKNLRLKKLKRRSLTQEINEEIGRESEARNHIESAEETKPPPCSAATNKVSSHKTTPRMHATEPKTSPPVPKVADAPSDTSRAEDDGFKTAAEWLRLRGPQFMEDSESYDRVKRGNLLFYRPRQS